MVGYWARRSWCVRHLAGSAGIKAPLQGFTEHGNCCAWPFAVQVTSVAPFNVMSAFCRSLPLPLSLTFTASKGLYFEPEWECGGGEGCWSGEGHPWGHWCLSEFGLEREKGRGVSPVPEFP